MIMYPVPGGIITDTFETIRPLYLREKLERGELLTPYEESLLHNHGAVDYANGSNIIAPESGYLFAFECYRSQKSRQRWNHDVIVNGKPLPFKNYFNDVYGPVVVLIVPDPDDLSKVLRTHLFCHMWGNVVFNQVFEEKNKIRFEEKTGTRYVLTCWYTPERFVNQGSNIGKIGNSGYSTGAHLHHEIHHGYSYNLHQDRIDPQKLF